MVGYGTTNTGAAAVEVDYIGDNPLKEFGVPTGLLLAGVGVLIFQTVGSGGDFAHALPSIGLNLIINLVFSFIGMFMIMRLFEVSFGSPGPAVIKAAACCVLPPAIAGVIGEMVGSDSFFVRMMVSAMLMMPLTYACFYFMFDMDFDEVIYLVVVIWLVNQWVVTFLLSVMLGSGGGGGGHDGVRRLRRRRGGGDESAEVSHTTSTSKNNWASSTCPRRDAWLKESEQPDVRRRRPCRHPRSSSRTCKGMGVQEDLRQRQGRAGGEIFVEMPKDKAKRKEMLDLQRSRRKTRR